MRLKRYFLNGYSLLLLVSIPIAVSCGLFAEDIVRIALGPQWNASVPIFRWLAPTILTSAIISPFGWFIYSLGMPGRGLSMALVLTPALICGCFYGLQYGPLGVAQAYSIVMLLWVGPAIIWSIHGTILSLTEILRTLYWPTTAGIISGFAALRASVLFEPLTPILRLTFEEAVLLLVYVAVIFSRGKYRQLCKNILSGISSMNDDMPRNEARSAIN